MALSAQPKLDWRSRRESKRIRASYLHFLITTTCRGTTTTRNMRCMVSRGLRNVMMTSTPKGTHEYAVSIEHPTNSVVSRDGLLDFLRSGRMEI